MTDLLNDNENNRFEMNVYIKWPEDGDAVGSKIYTVSGQGADEYRALLKRVEFFSELLPHLNTKKIEWDDPTYLEWRMKMMNQAVGIALHKTNY